MLPEDYFHECGLGITGVVHNIQLSRNNKSFVCLSPTSIYAPIYDDKSTAFSRILICQPLANMHRKIRKVLYILYILLYARTAFLLVSSRLFASDSGILSSPLSRLCSHSLVPIPALIIRHVAVYLN